MADTIEIKVKASASGISEAARDAIAQARAAATGADIKVKLNVDDTEAKAKISALGSGPGSIPTGLGRLALPTESIIPLIQTVGQLTGVLGLVPAAAGFAGTSLAALGVGISGITDTVKAYTSAMDASDGRAATSAAAQLSAANSLITASEGVANARRSVTDAERNYANSVASARNSITAAVQAEANAETSADRAVESAARSLKSAEDALTAAKHAALTAEQNLTDARLAATRALEDAPGKVRSAQLAQKQATIDLRNAQDALTATGTSAQGALQQLAAAQAAVVSPTGDHTKALEDLAIAQDLVRQTAGKPVSGGPPADIQQLSNAVQQAQQRVEDAGLAYQRATEDADKLTSAGVAGAKQVVSAQDQVANSQQSVRNATDAVGVAQESLVRAQVDGDQRVVEAKRRVVEAQRALVDTEITGDAAIAKAKQGVGDALRSQALAIASVAASAESAAGSLSVFNADLAKLAPNAQLAVRTFLGLRDTWHELRNDVQQRLFAGLSDDIKQVANRDLPVLRTGLDSTADSINGGVRLFAQWSTSSRTVGDTAVMFRNFATTGNNLHGTLTPILDILRTIGVVGSSFLPGVADDFARMAQSAADFIEHARQTGQLQQWIQTGIDATKQLWAIFIDLSAIVKDVMAAPGGFGLLDVLQLVTGTVRWMLDNCPILIPILEVLFLASRVWAFLTPVLAVVKAVQAWAAAQSILSLAMDASPIGLVIIAVAALAAGAYLLYKNWDSVAGFFSTVWGNIQGAFKWGINGVIQLLNGLVDGFNGVIRGLNIINPFTDIPYIPHIPHWLATGGIASGLAIVGEAGPELVHLPSGSQVMPASNTQNTLSGGPSGQPRIEVHVHGDNVTRALLDALRYEVRVTGGGSAERAFAS